MASEPDAGFFDDDAEFSLPSAAVHMVGGSPVVQCAGSWVALTLDHVEKTFAQALHKAASPVSAFECAGITHLDTAGALLIEQGLMACQKRFSTLPALRCDNPRFMRLLEMTESMARVGAPEGKRHSGPVVRFVSGVGKSIISECKELGDLVAFFGNYLMTVVHLVLHPSAIRLTPLLHHVEQVGVSAVPIVALLIFLVGMVVAYMGAQQLATFGAEIFVINLIEVTVLRELGVLLTAIVVAGRSGSAFTAQIGAMKANEEVDALRSMGMDPMKILVAPRIIALMFMLPALVVVANIMGLLGGGVAVWMTMGMGPESYAARVHEVISVNNFYVGIIKAPVFALVIGIVGCFKGLQVTGSAESVGRLTTMSVVQSIFLVIVIDAGFAMLFSALQV